MYSTHAYKCPFISIFFVADTSGAQEICPRALISGIQTNTRDFPSSGNNIPV